MRPLINVALASRNRTGLNVHTAARWWCSHARARRRPRISASPGFYDPLDGDVPSRATAPRACAPKNLLTKPFGAASSPDGRSSSPPERHLVTASRRRTSSNARLRICAGRRGLSGGAEYRQVGPRPTERPPSAYVLTRAACSGFAPNSTVPGDWYFMSRLAVGSALTVGDGLLAIY